jgi:hypothetical protein
MMDELRTGKILEGSYGDLIDVLPRHLLEGTEENNEKSVRITGAPTEIRTEHLANTRLERYCHASPFGLRIY